MDTLVPLVLDDSADRYVAPSYEDHHLLVIFNLLIIDKYKCDISVTSSRSRRGESSMEPF
jgi:hypothetical protein